MRAKRWDEAPVVITVAPCGEEVTRDDNQAVPYTPEEIANSAIEAAEVGATVVHLHAREQDGRPSLRTELFAEAIERIRSGSELITMVSTGSFAPIDERMNGLAAGPDLAGVEVGSVNFGEDPFVTSAVDARRIISRAGEAGIGLEVEALDLSHVVTAVRWLQDGVLPEPLHINLVFGWPGGLEASPDALTAMLSPLPEEAFWTVTAVGAKNQRRMLGLAVLHGAGGIRVGLEDAVYVRRGERAASNAALVEMAADLVRSLGREVATPAQARSLLDLQQAAGPVGAQ